MQNFFKGLGHTVSELDVSQLKVFPKTHFSMLIPEVVDHIKTLKGKPFPLVIPALCKESSGILFYYPGPSVCHTIFFLKLLFI